jgi:hypothetical protein
MKLSLGVVVWIAAPAHRAPDAMLLEFGAVVLGSILRAAIGMMDATLWRLPAGDRSSERR